LTSGYALFFSGGYESGGSRASGAVCGERQLGVEQDSRDDILLGVYAEVSSPTWESQTV